MEFVFYFNGRIKVIYAVSVQHIVCVSIKIDGSFVFVVTIESFFGVYQVGCDAVLWEGDRPPNLILFSATIVFASNFTVCGLIECNWLNREWYSVVSVEEHGVVDGRSIYSLY
ncbi:MAG: hypothetical protein N0C83_03250 [Candidatus Thiodiazotropha lotti]|nr:hypothetical protein [Candidatus Thiodiazotropha lotti]ODC01391.1 hypothetical protein A3197_02615 [Candidatus Thiodiazotropha endoloripes]